MPFGKKRDPSGGPDIDFDAIYKTGIEPAIRDAELDPIRADHEVTGGIIHKAMFERLLLCDFAVADLTTANANVFYELGVRHAARRQTTLSVFAEGQPMPFDVGLLRALPYKLGASNAFGDVEAAALRSVLAERLKQVRALAAEQSASDSPLVQLLQGYTTPELAHLRTDVFRERIEIAASLREQLRVARTAKSAAEGAQQLQQFEQGLGPLDGVEAGVIVDLYLSYRAVGAFEAMVALYSRLPDVLRRTVLIREQRAFALNRLASKRDGDERAALRDQAQKILEELIAEHGANAETCGLLGRIFKDRWDEARGSEGLKARGYLRRAIVEYKRGFEADWRDAFPGINALTLLDIEGSSESLKERDRLLPVVRYAVEQRLRGKQPDYWDHATLLELGVLAGADSSELERRLEDALASVREYWEPETTARNLRLIAEQRRARNADTSALDFVIGELDRAVAAKRGS
jgi:hypothetical protein